MSGARGPAPVEPLAVALLTYSTKPRGGVVHTLAVAEALAARGHAVEVLALGPPGARFFREPRVPARVFPYQGPERPIETKVIGMIDTYSRELAPEVGRFDVLHAQDCLSASALGMVAQARPLPPFLRTVHHVDDFRSPALVECQRTSLLVPDRLLVVSRYWRTRLRRELGVEAEVVPNGVDISRFRPPGPRECEAARARFGFGARPVVLSVGGIEPRKGSLRLLEGFAAAHAALEAAPPLLAIAGGETLFDYLDYRTRFLARLAELGLGDDVRIVGPVEDEAMPALYRAADAFALASTREGFGLAALEAQASGLPAVLSDLEVFGEFAIDGESALLARADDPAAFGRALVRALRDEPLRERLRARGQEVAAKFGWAASAAAHERIYREAVAAGADAAGRPAKAAPA
jgi:glycosyltransferase-like protein